MHDVGKAEGHEGLSGKIKTILHGQLIMMITWCFIERGNVMALLSGACNLRLAKGNNGEGCRPG